MCLTDLIQSLCDMGHRTLAQQLQCGGTNDTGESYKACDIYFCSISTAEELATNFIQFSWLVKLPKKKKNSDIKVVQHLV